MIGWADVMLRRYALVYMILHIIINNNSREFRCGHFDSDREALCHYQCYKCISKHDSSYRQGIRGIRPILQVTIDSPMG